MIRKLLLLLPLTLLCSCAVNTLNGVNQIQLAIYHPLCVDVEGASTAEGALVQAYACGAGKQSQEWTVKPATTNNSLSSNGLYVLINANSGMCMSLPADGDQYPAQHVIQANCDPLDPDMEWKIQPAPQGKYGQRIISVASGQCLDLPYGAVASIFPLQQYTCDDGDPAQGWTFHGVSKGSTP